MCINARSGTRLDILRIFLCIIIHFPLDIRYSPFGKILHRAITFRIFACRWQIERSTRPVRSPAPFSVRVYAFDRSVVRRVPSAALRLHRLCRPEHRCRMPSLIAFGRRWKVGSDDLLLPGAFLFWIHLFEWVVRPANVSVQIRASDERQSRKTKAKAPFESCESIAAATLGSKLQWETMEMRFDLKIMPHRSSAIVRPKQGRSKNKIKFYSIYKIQLREEEREKITFVYVPKKCLSVNIYKNDPARCLFGVFKAHWTLRHIASICYSFHVKTLLVTICWAIRENMRSRDVRGTPRADVLTRVLWPAYKCTNWLAKWHHVTLPSWKY